MGKVDDGRTVEKDEEFAGRNLSYSTRTNVSFFVLQYTVFITYIHTAWEATGKCNLYFFFFQLESPFW